MAGSQAKAGGKNKKYGRNKDYCNRYTADFKGRGYFGKTYTLREFMTKFLDRFERRFVI